VSALLQDLRYVVRTLGRTPGFAAVAALTLALGIGANTAVFSVVEGVLVRSLPFPSADRLLDLKQMLPQNGGGGTSTIIAYETWRTAGDVLEETAAYTGSNPSLLGVGEAQRVDVWAVSASFFPLLGADPLLGRAFVQARDLPGGGAAPVAVLSYAFWQSRFGGSRAAIGQSVTLDATTYIVVGVMPRRFRYPAGTALWTALGPALSGPSGARLGKEHGFWVVARVRPGVTATGAQRRLDEITRRSWATDPIDSGWLPVVTPLRDYLVGRLRTPLFLMFGAVGLVLLVASANVTGMLLARATSRAPDLAVRVALGATRGRLLRQALIESLVLAGGVCVLGVALAAWGVPVLVSLGTGELPAVADITVDRVALAVAAGISVCAGLAAGLAPGFFAARVPPADAMKRGSQGSGWRSRASDGFLIGQVALTVVLLCGAGLLARSFLRLTRVNVGFEPDHVAVVRLQLPRIRYDTKPRQLAWIHQTLQQAQAIPGVTTAAIASGIQLGGGAIGSVGIAGRARDSDRPGAWIAAVSADYFRVIGVPLLRGRALDAAEARTVVIDQAAARAYFPGEDPLGKQLSFFDTLPRTVVGVVGDTRQESPAEAPPPHIYEPLDHDPSSYLKVLARTAGEPQQVLNVLRWAVRGVDPTVPLDSASPLSALLAESIAAQRFYAVLLGVFAVTALLLAGAGIYGLAAYAVSRRTREIGVRIAIGAGPGRVLGLILGRGLALTFGGITLGAAGAFAATRLLRRLLFEIAPTDPSVFAGVTVVLAVTTLLACWLPARRATRVDPMIALRAE